MNKDVYDIYDSFINDFGTEDNSHLRKYNQRSFVDDPSEVEEFMTSKEIKEVKDNIESKFGNIPPRIREKAEEEIYFRRYTKRHEHKYTEKEMNDIIESCKCTIVHDYGMNDIYHMSDEEIQRNDMLAEISLKLGTLKRTYRKIDQYIEAMRIVVQAWELLEKNNYIHTQEEFFDMVAKGKIVSNRIIMPKMKRLDRYNMDMVIKYISNPDLDPKDLIPPEQKAQDDWYDDLLDESDKPEETEEEKKQRLLSPEEIQLLDSGELPEFEVKDVKSKYIKMYDKRNLFGARRNKYKLGKKEKYYIEGLHDIMKKIQSNHLSQSNGYVKSYIITNNMFQTPKKETDIFDKLKFTGSWSNPDDVRLYEIIIEEFMMDQHLPGDHYRTYGDLELSQFFRTLEDNGVNTIELRRIMNQTKEAQIKDKNKHDRKENKKIEAAIINRITKLNNNPKFKKMVSKAEKALNKNNED